MRNLVIIFSIFLIGNLTKADDLVMHVPVAQENLYGKFYQFRDGDNLCNMIERGDEPKLAIDCKGSNKNLSAYTQFELMGVGFLANFRSYKPIVNKIELKGVQHSICYLLSYAQDSKNSPAMSCINN